MNTIRPSIVLPILMLGMLIALVLTAHIIAGSTDSTLERNLLNSLHSPGFAVLAGVTLFVFRMIFKAPLAYRLAAILCVVVGAAGEVLQYFGPRDPALEDLLYDLLGAGGILLLAATFDRRLITTRKGALRVALFITAAALLIVGLRPSLWYSFSLLKRNQSLPQILGFEHSWEQEIYRSYGGAEILLRAKPPDWPVPGDYIVEIVSGNSQYSGIVIEPPTDWSAFRALSFVVSTKSEQTEVWAIRIDDRNHNGDYFDRFNSRIEIAAVPTRVRLPLEIIQSSPKSRVMDMESISRMSIFHQNSDGPSAIYFGDLRLEEH